MTNTKKTILLVLIAITFNSCSQSNEAYYEDVELEEDYNYLSNESFEAGMEETTTEKDESSYLQDADNKKQDVDLLSNANQSYIWSEEQKNYVPSTKENEAIISSKSLSNPYKDKKFIKTADLVFSVRDVYQSTVNIEEILIANDGFLINSNLYTEVLNSQIFAKSPELNVLVEEYETRNNITLRVPSENLHATLLALADEIVFLDSRMLLADDVGLKLLAEELEQKRNAKSAQNLQNQINEGGKLEDKVYAEQIAFERATQKDIALLKELSIKDKVEYSTITIAIYQNKEMRTQEIPNFDIYRTQFEASYGSELLAALANSIEMIKSLIVFILSIWPILLLLLVASVFLKRKFWN